MKKNNGFMEKLQAHSGEDMFFEMLQLMVEKVMEEGIERHVGAGRNERTEERRGHRNGYKPRTLNTRMGKLELSVPQARGVEPYSPMFFAKWQRSERALLVACAEMYYMGVSTRKVKHVLDKMGGFELSAATVSQVAQELDEKLKLFRERRLDASTWPYLMLDACYVKARVNGHVRSRAVLVAVGINSEGRREVLDWQVVDEESEDTWGELLRDLRARGMEGVRWIISDGHEGIRAAVARQYTKASWQRCWTHFIRNAMNKVGHKHKDALAKELKAARRFDDLYVCVAEANRVAERWEDHCPKVAKQIRNQFEETMAVHGLPPSHQRRVYTTNIIERTMREIKRRTRVVGIFPNDASAARLIGAQLLERHETWCCERARYLDMDKLDDYDAEQPAKDSAA
jgi:transposase-like protein